MSSKLEVPRAPQARALGRLRPHTLAIVAWSLILTTCATLRQGPPPLPNIVILYTDDQGYGDCGAFNPNAKFSTPNIDRIAAEGLIFTDGHSAGSVCTPSRYALLTGRYAWRTPQGGRVLGADADCMIEDGRETLASLLQNRGYATAIFGKWHLGLQIPGVRGERDWSAPLTDGPLQKGFDTFHGLPASMNFGALTWFDGNYATAPATLWTRKKFPEAEITTSPLDYSMSPPYDAERQTERDIEVAAEFKDVDALRIITEHTVDFIESRAGEPFFAYVAFTSPHLPHCTAPEFRGTSQMGNYGDFMAETDHRVGEILEALKRCNLEQDTLVILTSDNGPENNYKDWLRIYGHESNGGFRGGKRDVYEGGHRVPLLVRWPGVVAAGGRSDALVGQVDVLATLAEVVGTQLAPGQAEDSVSFLPHLQAAAEPGSARAPLIHHGRNQYAIRDGRWKLIFSKNPEDRRAPGPALELFDLEQDPGEMRNILGQHAQIAEELERRARAIVLGSAVR